MQERNGLFRFRQWLANPLADVARGFGLADDQIYTRINLGTGHPAQFF
jgi:hypothetical protein